MARGLLVPKEQTSEAKTSDLVVSVEILSFLKIEI